MLQSYNRLFTCHAVSLCEYHSCSMFQYHKYVILARVSFSQSHTFLNITLFKNQLSKKTTRVRNIKRNCVSISFSHISQSHTCLNLARVSISHVSQSHTCLNLTCVSISHVSQSRKSQFSHVSQYHTCLNLTRVSVSHVSQSRTSLNLARVSISHISQSHTCLNLTRVSISHVSKYHSCRVQRASLRPETAMSWDHEGTEMQPQELSHALNDLKHADKLYSVCFVSTIIHVHSCSPDIHVH